MTEMLGQTVVTVGDRAPNLALPDGKGGKVHLSNFWAGAQRALVLVFLRHFG